jgi:hypothetical protein
MLAIVGWVLIVVGTLSLLLGLVAGAQEVFKRKNEPGAEALFPTKLLEVFKELLAAPPYKFFSVFGLILIVIGLGLTGVEIFGAQAGPNAP